MRALSFIVALLCLCGAAVAQPKAPPPNPATQYIIGPIDLLHNPAGCVAAFSSRERLRGAYTGPAFQWIQPGNGNATGYANFIPGSWRLDTAALHAATDGYPTFIQYRFDQCPGGKNTTGPYSGRPMPLMVWGEDGLPYADYYRAYGSTTYSAQIGAFLYNASPSNLPLGNANSSLFTTGDNFPGSANGGVTQGFSWTALSSNGVGSDVGAREPLMIVSSYNSPVNIFGFNFDNYYYGIGAYPGGFSKAVTTTTYTYHAPLTQAVSVAATSGSTLTFSPSVPAGLRKGDVVMDVTTPAAISTGYTTGAPTLVTAIGATTVTISNAVQNGGVLLNDEISFSNDTATASILPETCIPNGISSCSAYQTFSGPPPFVMDTGQGYPVFLFNGTGSDHSSAGGHGYGELLLNYAATPKERTDVQQIMAGRAFPIAPAHCGVSAAAVTASAPNTGAPTPNTYEPITKPNMANAVMIVSVALRNPDYNGLGFRVQRADDGAMIDLYPTGCGFDWALAAAFGSGTTLGIEQAGDQTGHTPGFIQQYQAVQLQLVFNVANGLPAIYAPRVAQIAVTASATSSNGGQLIVTVCASCGSTPIKAGYLVSVNGVNGALPITGQVSGTPGGVGTYSLPGSGTISSTSVNINPSPYMMSDPLWINDCGCMTNGNGLWQDQTIIAVFQTGTSPGSNGNMIGGTSGWSLGYGNGNRTLQYNHSQGATDLAYTTSYSANVPHWAAVLADAASPQGLTMYQDGGAPATGTTATAAASLNANQYMLGSMINNDAFNGYIFDIEIYNDVESGNATAGNLGAARAWAEGAFGTP